MLQGIDPQHRPLYKDKLLCLLSVIVFIMNKEIGIFMVESYLKYGGGVFAGNSDFLWYTTGKKSFVACIDNFVAH